MSNGAWSLAGTVVSSIGLYCASCKLAEAHHSHGEKLGQGISTGMRDFMATKDAGADHLREAGKHLGKELSQGSPFFTFWPFHWPSHSRDAKTEASKKPSE